MLCRNMSEGSRVFNVLEDILEHIFLNLHSIQKNLQFWESRAEVSKGGLPAENDLIELQNVVIFSTICGY